MEDGLGAECMLIKGGSRRIVRGEGGGAWERWSYEDFGEERRNGGGGKSRKQLSLVSLIELIHNLSPSG